MTPRNFTPRNFLRRSLALAAVVLFPFLSASAAVKNVEALADLPVLEGGRVMPLDSYARLRLLQFSGRSTFEGHSALEWLAQTLFDPSDILGKPLFMINHPEVVEALGIDPGSRRRFSFDELHPGMATLFQMAERAFDIPADDRLPVDTEILRAFQNLNEYLRLMQAFRFAAPHPDFDITLPETLDLLQIPQLDRGYTFLDIVLRAGLMAPRIEEITSREPSTWTEAETELFGLSAGLFHWAQRHRDLPIPLIPLHGHDEEKWLSPWDVLAMRLMSDRIRQDIINLQELALAYRAGNQIDFDHAARDFRRSVIARVQPSRGIQTLDLELAYNRYDLFYRAEILYGLAFLLALAAILTGRRSLRLAALALILVALVPHTLGIAWRMIIMGRPPMTNLYATFLFVSWVSVLLGLAVEYFQRNGIGSVLASISGITMLLFSSRYLITGDTLGVVVAVLDSNFWLATHVVTVTIGYAGCIAAGFAGHIYLLQALRHPPEAKALKGSTRAIYGLLAFGLIFAYLGTMLGGVWADQSWGRFWGWDPKENGALMIVLWAAILFHARICNWIGNRGMAVGSIIMIIIVMIAWLGINLLGVGLHSYGFTSGLAQVMWGVIAFETAFILATAPFAKKSPYASLLAKSENMS
ncbi:MAG TPA: cytochrome c biogenesis protein CcsA [Kiritimatiellia bacterium]|nr:cytochrome c biogenesis protein CcsA [Kiritimatiellia bacterium]